MEQLNQLLRQADEVRSMLRGLDGLSDLTRQLKIDVIELREQADLALSHQEALVEKLRALQERFRVAGSDNQDSDAPAIFECKIGGALRSKLPLSADVLMRRAVTEAFTRLTGHLPEFCFSGWGGRLTPSERAEVAWPVVEAKSA